MSEYKVTASNLYSVTQDIDDIEIKIEPTEFKIELGRSGGMGLNGSSITASRIDSNGDLILTVVDGTGVVSEINSGAVDYELKQISNDWEFLRLDGDTVFRYQNNVMMAMTDTGDLNVKGDVNSNHTFNATNTYAAVDTPIWVSNDSRIFETTTNSLLFQNGGVVNMELTATGSLNIAGSINSNDNTL